VKIRFFIISMFLFGSFILASAQTYSVVGQISSSNFNTYVRGISGDGRLVVLESNGNIATENPDNADFNTEIFLYDYAQRRIFQITHTKSLLTDTAISPIFSNIKIEIENIRPSISNDGRWIAFSSNANGSVCTPPFGGTTITCTASTANPGNFDANSFTPVLPATGTNPLLNDANTEIYLYSVPAITAANLSSGAELPLTNLAGGAFTRVTNTPASRLPVAGSTTALAIVAEDNGDVIVDDNGETIAFTSTRDIVTGGNTYPTSDNSEVFVYKRLLSSFGQVTTTPRGTVLSPTWSGNPSISGNGSRIAFIGTGNNPVSGMTSGNNTGTAKNEEIFYVDLSPTGSPDPLTAKQITVTTPTTTGDVTNIFLSGKRMSRDGRYIAFDSVAELSTVATTANNTAIAVFVYDINAVETATNNKYRQVGPRGNADSAATQGDVLHFPTFSNYNGAGVPQTLVMSTRLNIKPDGTIPTTASDGLNPSASRPTQAYLYPLNSTPATGTFTRVTEIPARALISVETFPANNPNRMTFSIRDTELGTGNPDFNSEGYYLFSPTISRRPSIARFNFATGASNRTIVKETVVDPTPTPTPTPSPTVTPTPTPTPTVSPTPTPTPTPITPPAVQGAAPGMLVSFDPSLALPLNITPGFNIGSNSRSMPLPIELNGVSMTVAGAACGIRSVSNSRIYFVVPLGLPGGFLYPIKINLNGTLIAGTLAVAPAQPDIFTRDLPFPAPFGRANAENATNRVRTIEPFSVRTLKYRGGLLVPTVLRVYLTGVEGVQSGQAAIRVGSETVSGSNSGAVRTDIPGRYYLDFPLPRTARGIGDVPIVIFINIGGVIYKSRLDDTSAKVRIL
jgi:uncharacterized protein (TIGR03437 family)